MRIFCCGMGPIDYFSWRLIAATAMAVFAVSYAFNGQQIPGALTGSAVFMLMMKFIQLTFVKRKETPKAGK